MMLLRSVSLPVGKSWLLPSDTTLGTTQDSLTFYRRSSISLMASCSSVQNFVSRNIPVCQLKRMASDTHFVANHGEQRSVVLKTLTLKRHDVFGGSRGEYMSSVGAGSNGGGKMGGRGGSGDSGPNRGKDSADSYYQRLICANPGNSIFPGNYARFLKEVRGDYLRAEEYCARAIQVNGDDENVLSMYADLIWANHKDAPLADSYFASAVEASPDNCYVLASYAHFLWDSEGKEEEVVHDVSLNQGAPSRPLASP